MAKNRYQLIIDLDALEKKTSPIEKQRPPESGGMNKGLMTFVASRTVDPLIRSAIYFVRSNVYLATGSSEVQSKTDLLFRGIETGQSLIQSIGAGVAIGGKFGAGGAAIGGILGAGLVGFQKATNVFFDNKNLKLQRRIEDKGLQQLRERQGFAYNNSRIN